MSDTNVLTTADITEFKGLLTNLGGQYAKVTDELKTLGGASSETKEKIGKLDAAIAAFQADAAKTAEKSDTRMSDIEARINRGLPNRAELKGVFEALTESKELKSAYESGGKFGVSVTVKGSIHQMLRKDISGLSLAFGSQVLPQVVSAVPRLPIGVRTLVPQGRTTAGSIEYLEESSFTNNAKVVAELAPKPQSEKTFTPRTAAVRTIAHYFKVSKQSYEDLPGLAAQIESNGVYGVQLAEDNQLLNGDGVAPNLTGFMLNAAAAPPIPAGPPAGTLVDGIGSAVFDLAGKGYIASGAVVNPADWGEIAMLRDVQGRYIFANPQEYSTNGRMWGISVVQSASMAAGSYLVGAFTGNSLLLDREEVNVQVANWDMDDFTKNRLTVLIEERIALLIFDSKAFEKGTL